MMTGLTARPESNVRVEMKSHRERLKQARHPGVTQREAGFTPSQSRWLTIGVCQEMAGNVERGERIANWAMVILAGLLFLAMGYGIVTDHWAEKQQVQTVEAGR
jgi:uncharacterized membrane protein